MRLVGWLIQCASISATLQWAGRSALNLWCVLRKRKLAGNGMLTELSKMPRKNTVFLDGFKDENGVG